MREFITDTVTLLLMMGLVYIVAILMFSL